MTWRILNAESTGYSRKALEILQQCGAVENADLNRKELQKRIGNHDALIVRLGHQIDAEILGAAPKLKAIVTATTGLNHIDLTETAKRDIVVLSLRGEREFLETISATAEHTFGLILALIRKIPAAYCDVTGGQWQRDNFKGIELAEKTIGIIGYGRLGKIVARYAAAFGMNILAHDPQPSNEVRFVSLDQLLQQSDIVSLHAAYTPETENLIDATCFSWMKQGAYFINTARGEIVDESALLHALQTGHIAGAALDVLRGEYSNHTHWMKKDPLIRYAQKNDNLIITPHIGGATSDSMEKTEIFMAKKLKKFIESL